MKVKIKGEEYNFDFTSIWGPTYTYETLTAGKLAYNPQYTLCNHIMLYGILVQSNPDKVMTFDAFIEALNDVELAKTLMQYYFHRLEVLAQFGREGSGETDKKKEDGRTRTKRTRKS